jgi:hypothetical protein
MDELVLKPPEGVTVTSDLGGLAVSLPHPQRHPPRMAVEAGMVVGMMGMMVVLSALASAAAATGGMWLALAGLFVGALGVLGVAWLGVVLLEQIDARTAEVITVGPHHLLLSRGGGEVRRWSWSEIAWASDDGRIGLRSGAEITLAVGRSEGVQRWLGQLIAGAQRRQDPGDRREIPPMLAELRQS